MKLLKGDCLELMKTIESGSVDAVICDPPYGTTQCKWDSVIDFKLMWEQLNRIIKVNGAVVLFGSEPFSSALRMSNIKNYKYDWIWDKINGSNFLNAKKQPLRSSENISVFYKKQCTYIPQLINRDKKNIRDPKKEYGNGEGTVYGKTKRNFMFNEGREIPLTKGYPKNIIKINNKRNEMHPTKVAHPTQKPVLLMEYLIKTYTNENELILDFTMGSGSTGVAAINTNRNFIGIEQNDKYFNIAEQRTTDAIKEREKLTLFNSY
jgi:site-specific DNA-methyltransferase (adenine-specific)